MNDQPIVHFTVTSPDGTEEKRSLPMDEFREFIADAVPECTCNGKGECKVCQFEAQWGAP